MVISGRSGYASFILFTTKNATRLGDGRSSDGLSNCSLSMVGPTDVTLVAGEPLQQFKGINCDHWYYLVRKTWKRATVVV
jgi:hypothetical protein